MYKLEPDWGQKLNLSSEIEKISVLTCDIDKDGKQGIIIGADKVYAFDIHGVSQWDTICERSGKNYFKLILFTIVTLKKAFLWLVVCCSKQR